VRDILRFLFTIQHSANIRRVKIEDRDISKEGADTQNSEKEKSNNYNHRISDIITVAASFFMLFLGLISLAFLVGCSFGAHLEKYAGFYYKILILVIGYFGGVIVAYVKKN